MLGVCCWNVRGLNSSSKRNAVRAVISKHCNRIVCLQESKVTFVSNSFLRSIGRPFLNKCVYLESDGTSGGVITCWNSRLFTGHDVLVRKYSITVLLSHAKSGTNFYVTNVYGPATWGGKEEFFTEVAQLKSFCKGCWIICGDFNCIRKQEERKGKIWSTRNMTLFNNLISDLALIDPPMMNQSFTWSNMQKNPTMARLDRFLISTEWDQEFSLSKVVALPRVTSDHWPILLSAQRDTKGRQKIFRFEEAWLNHDGFQSKVPGWWAEGGNKSSAVLTFSAKLRHCRQRIKEWCKNEFYSIRDHKTLLMDEIHTIDIAEELGTLPEAGVARREELKDKLREVLNDEAAMWRARANQHWLREGDNNTKYFHCVANRRRRANGIGVVTDNGRVYQSEENDTFFFSVARKRYMRNIRLMWNLFEWASGLKINREKSELYYLGRIEGKAERLAQLLDCKVGSLPTTYLGNDWDWSRILGEDTLVSLSSRRTLSKFKERVSSFCIGQTEDRIGWRWDNNNIFSVRSAYRMLNDRGTRDGRGSLIWRLRIPLKIKVFCWLVLKKRTLTAVNLSLTGWPGSTTCALCGVHEESVDHLFTQCVFTSNRVTPWDPMGSMS
ncbi:putative ribonuclease H protein [Ananas comosus]|uniref:Putative ribonuclease H protein n=1 Tax=Ananas comosus TaxID=4615 RepID=A0A199W219_ANACO|nr:putative ribonuclease H protein [Ananas comosus]